MNAVCTGADHLGSGGAPTKIQNFDLRSQQAAVLRHAEPLDLGGSAAVLQFSRTFAVQLGEP